MLRLSPGLLSDRFLAENVTGHSGWVTPSPQPILAWVKGSLYTLPKVKRWRMSFNQDQVDEAFAALGLGPPGAAELTAIESINGPIEFVGYSQAGQQFEYPVLPATPIIAELPEVQAQVVPVAQMFDAALGYFPADPTLVAMVKSSLTEPQLATAIVSSQAFANVNNGGVLLDPNAAVSDSLVEALFIRDLGHVPSAATLAGFNGMTNAQAFLAFVTSDAVTQTLATNVQGYLMGVITLATGVVSGDPPADSVSIVGSTMHVAGAQTGHIA